MAGNRRCNRCGSLIPSHAPEGTCPACTLRAGLEPDARPSPEGSGDADETFGLEPAQPGHVLESLARSIGSIPRVLLADTAPDDTGVAIIKPSSDEMPAPAERGGRYQLFGEIARGGMGAVLKGRAPDLGRDLAVKVLLESHEDKPELVRRFVEEAQIGGQLQHPGIMPVYELGAFADRRPYFTMKLVKGRTLASLLAERESPAHDLPRFLSIFESICQTVAYAHARGVIHRDLKPSNVMLGSFGEVQVMHWGLAKVLADPAGWLPGRGRAGRPGEGVPGDRARRLAARRGPRRRSDHRLPDRCAGTAAQGRAGASRGNRAAAAHAGRGRVDRGNPDSGWGWLGVSATASGGTAHGDRARGESGARRGDTVVGTGAVGGRG